MDANNEAIPGPTETHEDGHSTFGFGRRACAGNLLADEALLSYIATALWAANFERARDQDGKEAPIDTEKVVDTGMVLYAHYLSLMVKAAELTWTLQQVSHTSARLQLGFRRFS